MIKALACDIDGTITDEKRRLDLRAVSLLRRIEGMGVPVVLATGNVLCLTEAASTYIGTTGPLIAENGGVLKPGRDKDPIYFCNVEGSEIHRAYEHLSSLFEVKRLKRSDRRRTEIAIHRNLDIQALQDALKGFNVRVVDTKFAIHIMDPRVNKGVALHEAANLMGLNEKDFAAIGDSNNDIEMLKRAGLGIGVGEESLKGVADFVTRETFAKGGVIALEHVLKELAIEID